MTYDRRLLYYSFKIHTIRNFARHKLISEYLLSFPRCISIVYHKIWRQFTDIFIWQIVMWITDIPLPSEPSTIVSCLLSTFNVWQLRVSYLYIRQEPWEGHVHALHNVRQLKEFAAPENTHRLDIYRLDISRLLNISQRYGISTGTILVTCSPLLHIGF